jgi:hypothetical protein
MADNNVNLPPLTPAQPGDSTAEASKPMEGMPSDIAGVTSSKDYMIGAGMVLAMALVFLFIRQAYANYLVGSQRRSPNQGNAAGWSLFGTLLFPGIGAGIAYVKGMSVMLSVPFLVPVMLATIVCLVMTVILSVKK